VSFECSSAVAQSQFSRQGVPNGRSHVTESASWEISVGTKDNQLQSVE